MGRNYRAFFENPVMIQKQYRRTMMPKMVGTEWLISICYSNPRVLVIKLVIGSYHEMSLSLSFRT
jgi:hypothetical protein